MKKYLICLASIVVCVGLFSCKKENIEQYKQNLTSPIDSVNSFFVQAEKIAGEDVSLYLITGVQNETSASLSYDLKWKYYFIKDHRIITFEIIQGKTKITDKIIQELAVGYEYIYKNDGRLKSILPPIIIWNNCISKYKKPILNIEMFAPLLFPKSNFICRLYSKEGYNQLGVDYFVFDATTGNDLTNK